MQSVCAHMMAADQVLNMLSWSTFSTTSVLGEAAARPARSRGQRSWLSRSGGSEDWRPAADRRVENQSVM